MTCQQLTEDEAVNFLTAEGWQAEELVSANDLEDALSNYDAIVDWDSEDGILCQHPNTHETLDSYVCEDCGTELELVERCANCDSLNIPVNDPRNGNACFDCGSTETLVTELITAKENDK